MKPADNFTTLFGCPLKIWNFYWILLWSQNKKKYGYCNANFAVPIAGVMSIFMSFVIASHASNFLFRLKWNGCLHPTTRMTFHIHLSFVKLFHLTISLLRTRPDSAASHENCLMYRQATNRVCAYSRYAWKQNRHVRANMLKSIHTLSANIAQIIS